MNSPHMRNVFIKIKIPFDKTKTFASLYREVSNAPLVDRLSGYSQEGDKHALILSVPLEGDAVTSLNKLSSVLISFIDYYPSFSEQPSEKQEQNVEAFLHVLRDKVLA